ncbi:DUF6923 family protein [Marinicella meishanensis]|uniref:DUF6923 family protein n=1 Tax=Marinicella meishanensis TaxID=2873263 RepID=UPI001CBD5BE3|nr:hypothetical protein [Marinicella sp. NBU2979]
MKRKNILIKGLTLMGLWLAASAQAGVNDFCAYLHQAGSLQQEPEVCSNFVPVEHKSLPVSKSVRGGSVATSYIYESRSTDTMSTHPVDDFSTQNTLGVVASDIFAMAFDENGNVLYGLENINKNLVSIDQSNGALNIIGPLTNVPAPDTVTGLAIGPDGKCYATSTDGTTTTLYTCDLVTGELTVVGSQTTTPLLIAITSDCNGTLYGHDIGDDNIYTIDPTSGAATVVGPTGLNANFAQDITYDREDQRMYGYIYTGGGTNTYGTIDVCTGAVTALAVDNPLGEHYGASKTSCALTDIIFRGNFDC